jgi:hypothetical protein
VNTTAGTGTGGGGASGSGASGGTSARGGEGGDGENSGSDVSDGTSAGGEFGEGGDNAGGQAGETAEPVPAPRLTDLNVAGTRLPLGPAFDPDTLRYVAYPTLPAEELTVTAVAAEGLTLDIAHAAAESGIPLTLPDIRPDTTFDVTVTNSEGASRSYSVVYVPTSFPELRVTVREPGAATDPLYVSPNFGGSRYVIKFNNDGVPLFYDHQPRPAYDFKKHPNGLLSYAADRELIGHAQVLLDSDYQPIDEVTAIGLGNTDQHDFLILPNGNFVVMGWVTTERDLSSYGGPAQQEVTDAVLQELTPERDVVFQWNTWGNVPYDENLSVSDEDYAHANSIFVDADDNWIVSFRATSQVLKIDRESGEVLWRFSGVSNEFTIEGDPFGGLCGQHTASRLENGNLLVFDNGQNCDPDLPDRGELTRIVEYTLDEENLSAELVWSYSRQGLYAGSQGSAQRLANGNTLIGWGKQSGVSATMVSEVTRSGDVVFEVEARLRDDSIPVSYRAWRFPD